MMNTANIKTVALFVLLTTTAFSCKKKDDPVTPTINQTGEVGFEFTNYAGDSVLVMNTGNYKNANNDSFKVTKFNYYITNVRLKRADGSNVAENNSYHLIQGDVASSKHFHIEDLSVGTYTAISFTIGVDSARNTSGAQTGALDPINGMFWTWNTGYIMAKLEGISPKSTATDKKFQHHIGGFSGVNNAVRNITIDLTGKNIVLAANKESSVMIKVDVLKWFSPNIISIASNTDVMNVSNTSKLIADNYEKMFSVTAVENQQ